MSLLHNLSLTRIAVINSTAGAGDAVVSNGRIVVTDTGVNGAIDMGPSGATVPGTEINKVANTATAGTFTLTLGSVVAGAEYGVKIRQRNTAATGAEPSVFEATVRIVAASAVEENVMNQLRDAINDLNAEGRIQMTCGNGSAADPSVATVTAAAGFEVIKLEAITPEAGTGTFTAVAGVAGDYKFFTKSQIEAMGFTGTVNNSTAGFTLVSWKSKETVGKTGVVSSDPIWTNMVFVDTDDAQAGAFVTQLNSLV